MSDRGRVLLIVAAVVLVGLLLSARFFAGFYVDYLWHQSVGRTDVFWGVLRAKLTMFGLFAATFIGLAVVNLLIADRLAPVSFSANTHPVVERFHEVFGRRLRLARIALAVVLGVLFAAPAISHWQDWLMFRNSKSFGIDDPQFGHDIGFYLFQLPFATFLLDWLFIAVLFITLLTVGTHVLNGGIVLQPPRPKVRRATKAHLAVLLAVLAVLKAGDYWVTRFELTTETRGFVRGATYSVVKAQLPAVTLLALVAVLTAGLYLSTLKTNRWRVPIIASALWLVLALVAGVIYPAAIQALVVNPNQRDREAPYIERNVLATRHALGIDQVQVQDIAYESVTERQVSADIEPLRDVRLLNPAIMVPRFRTDEGVRAGLSINDLDVDRYEIDGRVQQVVVGARELDLGTVANKSWQGKHLISTHGCGLVAAVTGQVDANGRPVYRQLELDRPELYFSDAIDGYAIVNTSVREEVCPNQADPGEYSGDGGVALSSTFRRLAFALDYLDYNLIGSSAVNDDSRLLAVRRVQDRVRKVAPFLSFDGDPYPVQIGGRVLWVVDGYTHSNRYPYGESGDRKQLGPDSGLDQAFNYVRNSVKATVDAYDGAINFYVVDDVDPVLRVWRSAFPDLFRPLSEMPAGLTDHLRYPEELFRVQTAAYSKYQLAPEVFFDRAGAWSVAQAPVGQPLANDAATANTTADATQPSEFATESDAARFVPYYSMFRAPGDTTSTFQLYRPFVPFSTDDTRRELQAFMTASSDPATYGQLRAFRLSGDLPDGPATIAATIASDADVAREITLLDQRGSQVIFGDLQMIPVGTDVLWMRPMYVQSEAVKQPTVKFVVLVYRGEAAFGSSMQVALAKLFPGFATDLGDVVGSGPATPTEPTDPTEPTPPTDRTPAELLAAADELFTRADEALRAGDLGLYAERIADARALVQQALEALQN
jgi:uncharacterized membrane protein (UPF0182 family)